MLSEHPKITYLEDQETQACGFRVYGTPWSLTFMDWSFMLPEEQLSEKWARISDDTQILVTHSPPYTFLDELNTKHLGSKSLAKRIGELDNLRLHIFGHIHCGYGAIRHPQCLKKLLVNASVCDEDYRPVNPIRIVDL
jgi:Icc-related predicted phosphoesterase